MTKVIIRRSDDVGRHVLVEFDATTIPRAGEVLDISGVEELSDVRWFVWQVAHELRFSVSRFIEQVVVLVVAASPSDPLTFFIEWQDPLERPGWIADEAILECSSPPSRGDILEIGVNALNFDPADATIVEVVAIVHNTLLEPGEEGDEFTIANTTQSALIVRNAEPGIAGDVQRIIARRN